MSDPSRSETRRHGSRRGGLQCSHSSRLNVPLLELGSNMTLQLAHERNGLLLARAQSSSSKDRARILQSLRNGNADLSKAQTCGHCNQLTARLTESLLHHLLFAKGQLPEPVSLLRKRKEKASISAAASRRRHSHGTSNHARKEDKLLKKLDKLRHHLEDAATHLSTLADNNGEGPSSRPYTESSDAVKSNDLRLLIVMGASATMPREVFVLDLIQSIGRCGLPQDEVEAPINSSHGPDGSIQNADSHLAEVLSEGYEQQREAARAKTSGNWERKLVRLLVTDQRLEAFLGTPLAPTKTHLFLSAPAAFRCPGWSARHHLDFDLDRLCEPATTDALHLASDATDSSTSSLLPCSMLSGRKRAPTSPLQGQDRRWHKAACGSSSSVASSWPEDSASEHIAESSISSVSDDSRPPSAADKPWHTSGNKASAEGGWLATVSSPQSIHLHSTYYESQSLETSRTGSSLGSSTVYGHDSADGAMTLSRELRSSYEDASGVPDDDDALMDDLGAANTAHQDGRIGMRRRSREPKAGSLLSRNLLRAKQTRQHSYAGSDSSSVRSASSSAKRAPRCAGLQIDFTDPGQADSRARSTEREDVAMQRSKVDRYWFQCEAVLEGFR